MSSIYVAVICKSAINRFIYGTAADGNIIALAIGSKIMSVVSIITSVYVVSYMTTLYSRVIFFGFANHIRAVDISNLAFFQPTVVVFSRCLTAASGNAAACTVGDQNISDFSAVIIYSYDIVLQNSGAIFCSYYSIYV